MTVGSRGQDPWATPTQQTLGIPPTGYPGQPIGQHSGYPGQPMGPPPGYYPPPGMGYPPMGMSFMSQVLHPMAIASMVLGIISCVCLLGDLITYGLCALPGLICGIIAIVLGFKGRNAINNDTAKYKGQGIALTGLICGFIGAGFNLLALLFLLLIILLYMSLMSSMSGA